MSEMNEKQAGKQPQESENQLPRAPPSFPPPSCPRCYSRRTKFCYYNNYSVSQPRYFCKNCRRYWTHGGVLRDIPMGGTSRKRGRPDAGSSSAGSQVIGQSSLSQQFLHPPPPPVPSPPTQGCPYPGGIGAGYGGGHGPSWITETFQSFTPGSFFNQAALRLNGGNTVAGGTNAYGGLGGRVRAGVAPLPTSSRSPPVIFPHFSLINNFNNIGVPPLQPSHQRPPVFTRHNMVQHIPTTSAATTSSSRFLSIARGPTAGDIINTNEWPELSDMDIEGDPLQDYRPSQP